MSAIAYLNLCIISYIYNIIHYTSCIIYFILYIDILSYLLSIWVGPYWRYLYTSSQVFHENPILSLLFSLCVNQTSLLC